MSFLTPFFLLGGLAIGLPILFHLVRRSAREKLVFSSLMFLKATPPRMTRRNRLEHIFLLLLRCAVICILSLGFARPFLQKPNAAIPEAASGSRIIVLVDTSASMRREGVWPAALAKAEDQLKHTSPGDQVAIYTFDDQLRSLVSFAQWNAMSPTERPMLSLQQLGEQKPAWHGTHLGNALIGASEALDDAERREQRPGRKRIVVITDLQEGSRLDGLQGYEWPRGVEVSVETIKAARPTNAGLQWVIDAEDSVRSTSDPGIRLRVSNSSDATSEQFQIQWADISGAPTLDAYVPPGQSRIVPAPQLPTNTVGHRLTLSGDADDFDNTVYLVPPRAGEINVLFLGDDAENDPAQLLYYLKRAFQDTRRQIVHIHQITGSVPLTAAIIATNRLLVVSGGLAEDRLGEVERFIQQGGNVLLVMNDARSAAILGRVAGVADLTATEAPADNYAMLGQIDFEHPLFAPFSDPRFSDFTKIRFWKHRQVSLDRIPGARAIGRYDDGNPAILEVPHGRGRLIVFTSSWRPADSQLALSSKFVPLLYSILEQAGGLRAQLTQYRVGETIDLSALTGLGPRLSASADPGQPGVQLTVRKPDGSSAQLPAGETRFEAEAPGMYEVAGTASARFAVNLDASESKTAPLPVEELQRLNLPIKPRDVELSKNAAQRQQLESTELENRQKLWRWLIVIALVVLMMETWLAGWLTRRTAPRVEAA